MKSSLDCCFRLDLLVSGCSIRYLDSWYVGKPRKENNRSHWETRFKTNQSRLTYTTWVLKPVRLSKLRLSKRQSPLPTTVLLRTTLTRTIKLHYYMLPPGSNHLLYYDIIYTSHCFWRREWSTWSLITVKQGRYVHKRENTSKLPKKGS